MYNVLVEQLDVVEEELKNKIRTLGIDQKCLEYKAQWDSQKEYK